MITMLVGCGASDSSGSTSSSATSTENPVAEVTDSPEPTPTVNPEDATPPPWLTLAPGQRAILTSAAPGDDSMVWTCQDGYSYSQFSSGAPKGGCIEREGAQIVTIKQYDSDREAVYVKGKGWSGVVGSNLEPIIPGGTVLVCQPFGGDSLSLYSAPNRNADDYNLRDGTETLRVSHDRLAGESWAVAVKVLSGYGTGRSGYFKADDLSGCVLSGTMVQVAMKPAE